MLNMYTRPYVRASIKYLYIQEKRNYKIFVELGAHFRIFKKTQQQRQKRSEKKKGENLLLLADEDNHPSGLYAA